MNNSFGFDCPLMLKFNFACYNFTDYGFAVSKNALFLFKSGLKLDLDLSLRFNLTGYNFTDSGFAV